MFQGGANVEDVAGVEGPGSLVGGLGVEEDEAADGAEGGGVKVDGAIEVLPCGREEGDVGLAEEVELELGLREQLVP